MYALFGIYRCINCCNQLFNQFDHSIGHGRSHVRAAVSTRARLSYRTPRGMRVKRGVARACLPSEQPAAPLSDAHDALDLDINIGSSGRLIPARSHCHH